MQLCYILASFGWWTSESCTCLWSILQQCFATLCCTSSLFRNTAYILFLALHFTHTPTIISRVRSSAPVFLLLLKFGIWLHHWLDFGCGLQTSLSSITGGKLRWRRPFTLFQNPEDKTKLLCHQQKVSFGFSGSFDRNILTILSGLSRLFQVLIKIINGCTPSVVLILSVCSRRFPNYLETLSRFKFYGRCNDPKGSVVISHEDDEENVRG